MNKVLEKKIPSLWTAYRYEIIPFFEQSIIVAKVKRSQGLTAEVAGKELILE